MTDNRRTFWAIAEPRAEISEEFRWRTAEGKFLAPASMETRHLFFTWLMIWNHSAPEEFQKMATQRYTFPSFYTTEYMVDAFTVIYWEIKDRKDLAPRFQAILEEIEDYFNIKPSALEERK